MLPYMIGGFVGGLGGMMYYQKRQQPWKPYGLIFSESRIRIQAATLVAIFGYLGVSHVYDTFTKKSAQRDLREH